MIILVQHTTPTVGPVFAPEVGGHQITQHIMVRNIVAEGASYRFVIAKPFASQHISPVVYVEIGDSPASALTQNRLRYYGIALGKPIGNTQRSRPQRIIAKQRINGLPKALQRFFVLHHVPVFMHRQQVEPVVGAEQKRVLGGRSKKF